MPERWRGVTWAPIVKGRCTVHGTKVEKFTKLCYACHREQLGAAGALLDRLPAVNMERRAQQDAVAAEQAREVGADHARAILESLG